jgi:dynein heavy chain
LQLAADAEAELKKAEPALLAANEALEGLDKKHISEIKSFTSPPDAVATVMAAVMVVLGKDTSWPTVKKELAAPDFVKGIMLFDKENIGQATLKKIEKYTRMESFQPAAVTKVSTAAGALCQWCRSLEDYAKALKVVGPKRAKKAYAEEQLAQKLAELAKLESDYNILAARLAELEQQHQEAATALAGYKRELDGLQVKIDRGERLVSGLAGEKTRWEAQVLELDSQYEKLIGDCILAAAFMSYCGPFPSEYRDGLISDWLSTVEAEKIPYTQGFDFSDFMAGAAQARAWQLNGLPTDKFSTENGVFVSRGLRWALNIDPQSQAMNWIKRMEGDSLLIADQKDANFLKVIERAVINGRKVLFLDVGEELDPVLDNVLNRSLIQVGRNLCVKIGDKEVAYHEDFKLYITTRMGNPHYTPEVSTKVAVVNFTVKESGLEEQCLGIVVQAEQPSLENTKNEVIQKIATNKATIRELEDKILRMLSESKVNLLEDVALIDTLQSSKETADAVKQALDSAEITMRKIDDTREQFRQCGRVASILFFVLNDLVKIDPMY